jgi:hypothetical protein
LFKKPLLVAMQKAVDAGFEAKNTVVKSKFVPVFK